ncbi:MAG: hypothetical protein LAT75_13225 [Candidatus Cyclonatronum sp.]|uniref:protein-disulfide reductase DsbD domain-containing protein n=1 Tax=Cyclonatronum sp. TaxID=3024185 RepID=UPI0025BC9DDE|nr:protein-disulfide reductase DsbD domain-containing protein [Cyclonatronum sp.]MCC5934027.1 hypothetical protein [Balneolales bacterium]MCH8487825.1 hypothetical protein [Cyclonatronum sp.]
MKFFLFVFISFFVVQTSSFAQPSPGSDHVDVTLIAEHTDLSAGESTTLGFHFDIEQGWHTYWRNPGDSGLAARISWQLPEGFSTGEIHWPYPGTFEEGHLITYGYKDETLLMQPLFVSADVVPGSYTLEARLEYLVCEAICLPAFEQHSISLEVTASGQSPSADAQIFARFRDKLPAEQHDLQPAFTTDNGHIILRLEGALARNFSPDTDTLRFYPIADDLVDNTAPQQVETADDALWMQLRLSRYAHTAPRSIKGLLVHGTENGKQAFHVESHHP